jgi:hypothetical protein
MKEFIMRRRLTCMAAIVLEFCFFVALRADIIGPETILVKHCIKIINATDFTNFTVIAAVSNYGNSKIVTTYVIKSNECLEKGDEFNGLSIIAVQQDYFKQQGLENLPLASLINDWVKYKKLPDTASPMQLLSAELKFESLLVDAPSPLRSVISEYRLALQNGYLKLELAKKTEIFSDGKSTSTNY